MADHGAEGSFDQNDAKAELITPPAVHTINLMGALYLTITGLFFYLLIATWPVLDGPAFKSFHIFFSRHSWEPDKQMLFTVMVAGALGSLTHTMTSFGDYVGNRQLSTNWLWFMILRVPIGMTLAVLFYFIVRGGLLLPTLSAPPAGGSAPTNSTLQLNPYGMAAFAALAGMFSKQATDKLAAVFDAVFAMTKPVERDNPLNAKDAELKVAPAKLTQGKLEELTVTGSGFQTETKATVNGKDRAFKKSSATEGKITLLEEDVRGVGELAIVVVNPNKDVFRTTIKVVAA
ncbi:hypothetical protein CVM73_21375 [Bradyrhizobium forestalis]|uniref:IPT/TIG domain-containing protein n=1 Tax=Bradyrhizobium forestalis TaxID=1419263 RepID=A0A2M8R5U4_9BRAD|nr:hypothetical protein [Bradyrhizobium forestalis]PJG53196.1 hypothetical protein CVM73_21375 [Bradyrhizobium forestalis]